MEATHEEDTFQYGMDDYNDDDETPDMGAQNATPDEGGEAQKCDGNITVGEFFQQTLNNGIADGVACFKLLVLGVLVVASLVVGNVAFVYTNSEIMDDYNSNVSFRSLKKGNFVGVRNPVFC